MIKNRIFQFCACLALAGVTACDDFLQVENPNVVDAETVDPNADAPTFAQSAQQDFVQAFSGNNTGGNAIAYVAWFTGEALVSETFPTRNDFGRRQVPDLGNGDLNGYWFNMTRAIATGEKSIELLSAASDAESNPFLARASLFAGFAILQIGLDFCEGVIAGGPLKTSAQMVDEAILRFTRAIEVGTRAAARQSGAARTETQSLVSAALVGRARAYLQKGDKPRALADANGVPAGFVFNIAHVDDVSNRARLSNGVWAFTFARGSISPATAFRELNDPRVPVSPPRSGFNPQDGETTPFYTQNKYSSYAAPVRIASRIEADYIAAEAQGTAAMRTLIAARRAANNQPAYTGATTDDAILTEFFNQSAREFYLEAKRLGDFRRMEAQGKAAVISYMPVPGARYHKNNFAPIGGDKCFPLPQTERTTNPNLKS